MMADQEVPGREAAIGGDVDSAKAYAEPTDTEPSSAEPKKSDAAKPKPNPQVRRSLEQTKDDTDAGWGERGDESAHDRWLREQRPPHWE